MTNTSINQHINISRYQFIKVGCFVILLISCFLVASPVQAGIITRPMHHFGLVGYWAMNEGEGETVYDLSVNDNHGTRGAMEAADWIDSKPGLGKALNFDNSEWVDVGTPTQINTLTQATVSVWAWVDTFDPSGADRIWGLDNNGSDRIAIINSTGSSNQFYVHDDIDNAGNSVAGCGSKSTGTWYHIVFTLGGGNLILYCDGVEVGNESGHDKTFADLGSTTHMDFGSYKDHAQGFLDGRVDEVRIYDRILSTAEVARLYKIQKPRIGASNIGQVSKGLVGYWTFDGPDIDSTTVFDRSVNSNDGTINGDAGPATSTGKIGQAFEFSTTSDYIEIPDTITLGTGNSTHAFWFKIDSSFNSSTVNSQPFISKILDGENNFWIILAGTGMGSDHASAPGTLEVKWEGKGGGAGGSRQYTISNTSSWSANNWYHVAVVKGATISDDKIYINGVDDTNSNEASWSRNYTPITGVWRWGRGDFEATTEATRYLDGKIDDARIYNRALTAAEVATLYNTNLSRFAKTNKTDADLNSGLFGHWTFDGPDINGTTATDIGSGNNNGTLQATAAPAIGRIGQALTFDGDSDYVSFANDMLDSETKGSIATWVKFDDIDSTHTIFSYGDSAATEWHFYFAVFNTGKLWTVMRESSSNNQLEFPTDAAVITAGKWIHVAITNDGTTYTHYVDGEVAASTFTPEGTAVEGDWFDDIGGTAELSCIGALCRSSNANYHDGEIDDFRIYNRGLTASEVKRLYNMGR